MSRPGARKSFFICLRPCATRCTRCTCRLALAHDLSLTNLDSNSRPRSDSGRTPNYSISTMNSQPPPRRGHKKRVSALRLSSDSTVPALPLYTSPQWQSPTELDPTDLPPDYPDSAEEADEDTDEESSILYHSPPLSPRRSRRSQGSSRSKPRRSSSNDPYLDSLLARSVHALEMSNVLLQSSMTTQSTLNNVLTRNSQGEASLETHVRNLSSRISGGSNWMDDLDQISRGVEGLFEEEAGKHSREASIDSSTSQSLPASSSMASAADQVRRSHLRRPSLDLRNASLSFSAHERHTLVAPPPRAMTMYIDSTEDPDSIMLPSTLGLRSLSRTAAAQVPVENASTSKRPLLLHATGSEPDLPKRAVDILSSMTPKASSNGSLTASPSSSYRNRPRSSSASTSTTTLRRLRRSRSPHAPSSSRSPGLSPDRSPTSAMRHWDTPPIVELPSASSSSSSDDLRVDRTVSYLRNILETHPPTRTH